MAATKKHASKERHWRPQVPGLSGEAQRVIGRMYDFVAPTVFHLALINFREARVFVTGHRAVCARLQSVCNSVLEHLTACMRRDVDATTSATLNAAQSEEERALLKAAQAQRADELARVALRHARQQILRLWVSRAATLYVYNVHGSQMPVGAGGLQRTPIGDIMRWAAAMRADFAVVLQRGDMDVNDLLAPLTQALHVQADAEHPHLNRSAMPDDDKDDEKEDACFAPVFNNDRATHARAPLAVQHLAYFAAQRHDTASELSLPQLHNLWMLHRFGKYVDAGVSTGRNPLTVAVLRAQHLAEPHVRAACGLALARLEQHVRGEAVRLAQYEHWHLGDALVTTWCARVHELRNGLETAGRFHRMAATMRAMPVAMFSVTEEDAVDEEEEDDD